MANSYRNVKTRYVSCVLIDLLDNLTQCEVSVPRDKLGPILAVHKCVRNE
jgi:hypothetical protein